MARALKLIEGDVITRRTIQVATRKDGVQFCRYWTPETRYEWTAWEVFSEEEVHDVEEIVDQKVQLPDVVVKMEQKND
jgi:hypothetical protein